MRSSMPSIGLGTLHIRTLTDTRKPLRKGTSLALPRDRDVLVLFFFQNLPNFCYLCGRLTHVDADCDVKVNDSFNGEPCMEFGLWLLANKPNFSAISFKFDISNLPYNGGKSDSSSVAATNGAPRIRIAS